MPEINVQLKLFNNRAKVPVYGSAGAAAFDLHANLDNGVAVVIMPGETVAVKTGIGIFLRDPAYGLFIWERSGLGKKGIERRGGLVDSDYQGEIMVLLTNGTNERFIVKQDDRIAQALIGPVYRAAFEVVEEFDTTTERGTNGLGSTGV